MEREPRDREAALAPPGRVKRDGRAGGSDVTVLLPPRAECMRRRRRCGAVRGSDVTVPLSESLQSGDGTGPAWPGERATAKAAARR